MVPERIRRLSAGGFGLAELAVALALMAAIAATAAPWLITAWRAAVLRAAAEELAAAVNLGRQLAISLNAPVCVAVGGSEVRFQRADGGGCSGVEPPGGTPVRLGSGLPVTATGAGVVFTGLGAATPAGRYTVGSEAVGGTRSVVVSASGRVTVQ